MFALHHVRLGHGIKSVSAEGVAGVVNLDTMEDSIVSEQQFTFNARLYDSHEELELGFRAALSLSGSAAGAELALGGSAETQTQSSNYDAYYMMHLEYRHYRRELKLNQEQGALLKANVQEEIETLKDLAQWQAFYRKNGDLVVNAVTYGERVIIIVSLNRKIRNEQVRQALETNIQLPNQAALKAELEKQLKHLTDDTVASVQIHSIGNARPNFLEEIDNLARLRERITGFVNSSTPTAAQASKEAEKKKLPEDVDVQTIDSESGEMSQRTTSHDTGTIIHYTTCAYLDLMPNSSETFKHAYHQMLKCTSLARQYLQALAKCTQRTKAFIRDINIYLQGDFVTSHAFEAQAHELLSYLIYQNTLLSHLAEEILNHVSGLGDTASKRRKAFSKAQGMYDLVSHFPDLLTSKPLAEQSTFICEYLEAYQNLKTNAALPENKQSLFNIQDVFEDSHQDTVTALKQKIQNLERITNTHLDFLIQKFNDIKNEVQDILEKTQSISQLSNHLLNLLDNLLRALESPSSETHSALTDLPSVWGEVKSIIWQRSTFDGCPASWANIIQMLSEILKPAEKGSPELPERKTVLLLIQTITDFIKNIEMISSHPLMGRFHLNRTTFKSAIEVSELNSDLLQFAHLLDESLKTNTLGSMTQTLLETTKAFHEEQRKLQTETGALLSQLRLQPEHTQRLEQQYKAHLKRIDEHFSDSLWWENRWQQIYEFSKELDRLLDTSPIDTPMHAMSLKSTLEEYYALKKCCDQQLRQLETSCSTSLPATAYCKILEAASQSLGALLSHIPNNWLTKSSHKNRLLEKYHKIKKECDELLDRIKATQSIPPLTPAGQELQIEAIQTFLTKLETLRASYDDTRPATCCGVDFKYSAYLSAEIPLIHGFLKVYSNPIWLNVPSQTRFLRFKCCTEAFIPHEPTFTLRRTSKIRMDGQEGKHNGLHKKIRPLERIKPRTIKRDKVREYFRGHSGKSSLIQTDKNLAYKRVYIDGVEGLPPKQKATMMLYVQLGPTKAALNLSPETPHPQADYGSRVNLSGQASREPFSEYPPFKLAPRRNSSPHRPSITQSAPNPTTLPHPSFFRTGYTASDIQRAPTEDRFGKTFRAKTRQKVQDGSNNSISQLVTSSSFLGVAQGRAQQPSSSEPSSREENEVTEQGPAPLHHTQSADRQELEVDRRRTRGP